MNRYCHNDTKIVVQYKVGIIKQTLSLRGFVGKVVIPFRLKNYIGKTWRRLYTRVLLNIQVYIVYIVLLYMFTLITTKLLVDMDAKLNI